MNLAKYKNYSQQCGYGWPGVLTPVVSFNREINPQLAKRLLKTNRCLANRRLTSLVKEATGHQYHSPDFPPMSFQLFMG